MRKKRLEHKMREKAKKKSDLHISEVMQKKTQLILDKALMFIEFYKTDRCQKSNCNDFMLNSEFGYQTIILRRGFYI